MNPIRFNIPPAQRIILLLLTFLLGLIVTAFLSTFLLKVGGESKYLAMLRIGTVAQDLFMLIFPAVITAMVITRQPARLLCLDTKPSLKLLWAALVVMIVSSPMMTWIIKLNQSMTFPPALAELEQWMRTSEESAAGSINLMLGAHTPVNLIINLLIVGVLAGLAEELFFRGALQRVLQSCRMPAVAAVWITAVIFSAVHMQFFGFVPRLLLGAFFGYLLLWSGSVWLPVAAHVFNNCMFVLLNYFTGSGDPEISGSSVVTWLAPLISCILTVAALWFMYRGRVERTAVAAK
ncbi:MAG: CPBP family intramembrane metalloprotease [Muribaculaceae bacterium]|nr:CPBP family intramembrane metalloprotease [Muribaculaceae bacterium]